MGIGLHTFAQKIHLPVKVDHQWTFLEVSGKTTHLDPEKRYDHLGDVNLPWFGRPDTRSDFYLVEKGGKSGLVTASFEPVVSPSWKEIHPISPQYFLVADEAGYAIIDRKEKPVLKADHYEAVKLHDPNTPAFFLLKKEGKWGVKKRGQENWSIRPDYPELEYLDVGPDGFFKARKDSTGRHLWQVLDWKGSPVAALGGSFEKIEPAGDTYLAFQEIGRKSNWSIRNLAGKEQLILDPETFIMPLNKHLFAYKEKGSDAYSLLVMRDKITPLVDKFDYLQTVNDELVFFRRGEKSGFIQPNGSPIALGGAANLEVFPPQKELLRVKGAPESEGPKKYGLYALDQKKFLQPCQFDSIAPFQGSFARVWQDGKTGLIDDSGKLVIAPTYEEIPYLASNLDSLYCYWKDSVRIIPLDQNGHLQEGTRSAKRSATPGPERYFWFDFGAVEETSVPELPDHALFPNSGNDGKEWRELAFEGQEDTLWVEKGKRFWQMEEGNFQLMTYEQVEVVVRERTESSGKKNKKKSKKPSAPAPKKTKMVMKWVKKEAPYKFLREPESIGWTLAYHDYGGLVSNELTHNGRTRFSVRKINAFDKENHSLLPGLEMIGIRLSDFSDGLPYAAFIDPDGKMGLVNKAGRQAAGPDGEPLRFTYISKPAEGKMQVCHKSSSFGQVGLSIPQLVREFNIELVSGPGDYSSELRSDQPALWGYIDPDGKIVIPFEYEVTTPFKDHFAINKKEGKWGAVNAANEMVIPFEFDAIFPENDYWKVVKGSEQVAELYFDDQGRRFDNEEQAGQSVKGQTLFSISNNEDPPRYGFLNRENVLMIPHQFDEVSEFQNGLATVRQGRNWAFIDETGKEVIRIDSSILGIIEVGRFSEGLCPILKTTVLDKKPTRKYGYLNTQGKLTIPPQFDGAAMFQDGVAVVDSLNFSDFQPGQNKTVPRDLGLIDKQGNMITGYEFRKISPFNEAGFAEVIQAGTGKQGLLSKDGKVLTNAYYTRVKSFKDGMAALDGNYWKIFDYTGKSIPAAVPDITSILFFEDQDLIVRDKADRWHHLKITDGKAEVIQGGFTMLQPFENGYSFARLDDKNLIYGRNQSQVVPSEGQQFKFWSENLIGVKTPRGENYANLGLQNPFDRNFDAINDFQDGVALVQFHGKTGALNRNGYFILPPKFKNLSRQKDGSIKVEMEGGLYGLWSKTGKEIVPAKYDTIRFLDNGIIRVENADFIGYYRTDGQPVWELEDSY